MAGEREKAPNYVQLHTHSNLSIPHDIVALASPEELVVAQKNKGYSHSSLTDRDTLLGLFRFIDKSNKEGMKPIVGIEKMIHIGRFRRSVPTLIYPKNNEALYSLYPYVDKDILSLEDINTIADSSYVITTGDFRPFKELLMDNENVFRGVHNTNSYSLDYAEYVEEQTGKSIVTHEVRMIPASDQVYLQFFLRAKERKNRRIPTNRVLEHTLKNQQEIASYYKPKRFGKMIERTIDIAESISLSLPEQYGIKAVGISEGKEEGVLKSLVIDALAKRDDVDQDLLIRVQKELQLINNRSLNNFILVCYDIVEYCKKNEIEFSTLGSGTNSVVLELLGIHQVFARDLDYTRFINPDRPKNPDIDFEIDDLEETHFEIKDSDEERSLKEYLFSKYGNFAPLTLISMLREKTIRKIMDETGAELSILQIKELDARDIPWTLRRHPTAHAFLDNTATWNSHGSLLHQIEKDTVEDVVNLPTLDILQRAPTRRITLIKQELKRRNLSTEIERNDKQTLDAIFKKGIVLGKSNIESPHMHNVLTSLGSILEQPTERDIAHALAIARTNYKERERYLNKQHPIKSGLINYPEIGRILEKTNYTIFYQEQLPQIAIELAGLPPSTSEMYKKLMKETVTEEDRILHLELLEEGLLLAGYPKKIVKELIEQTKNINYSFVEGHAREMANKAYQLGFYAERYPSIFWNAVFTHLAVKPKSISKPYTLQAYVNEALRSKVAFDFPNSLELRDVPRLDGEKIIVGSKLFLEKGDYERVLHDLQNPNFSHEQKVFSQLKNLGITFTDSPIALFNQHFHYDLRKDQQWVVGHIEGIKENRNRKTGEINSYFVVFESGKRLNVTMTEQIYQRKKKNLKGSFWYTWLVNDPTRQNRLEILDARPIGEVIRSS